MNAEDLRAEIKHCFRESIEEIKNIPTPPPLPDRINLDEACRIIGCSRSQIYKLSMRGEIPKAHYGKKLVFSRKTLLDWMEARTISRPSANDVMTNKLAITAKKRLR